MKHLYTFLWLCAILCITVSCNQQESLKLSLVNPLSMERKGEIVELDWSAVKDVFSLSEKNNVIKVEGGDEVPYQVIYDGQPTPQKLLLEIDFLPLDTVTIVITKGTPKIFEPKVAGRLVPERKDDFSWENNKVAFRMYGPALEATGEISNGIDFWGKRTEKLVTKKWYTEELSGGKTYHEDGGEGCDFFKVGRTLGAGSCAPLMADTLVLANNFIKATIIDSGLLRITFLLEYAPFVVGSVSTTETKKITLDANSHFNKITAVYPLLSEKDVVAVGFPDRAKTAMFTKNNNGSWMMLKDVEDTVNGSVYFGAFVPDNQDKEVVTKSKHFVLQGALVADKSFTYYAGCGWDKSDIKDVMMWLNVCQNFSDRLQHPIQLVKK